jgi:thiol:disulfide interchange protein DsbC
MTASRRCSALALLLLLGACAESPPPAAAPSPKPAPPAAGAVVAADALSARLTELVGRAPDEIREAPIPGMLQARWGTNFAYVTADGKHLLFGDLVHLPSGEALTEASRKTMRREALAQLGEENMISFLPKNPKHVVTVFTDIDCGFCRKMHREMDAYHAAGIGIRYVFYPRSGPGTESFRKTEAVWCSEDRHTMLTKAKDGHPVPGKGDCPNPILREYQLGQEIGLRGTPMIILEDGEVVNGYVPAQALAAQLAGG